MIFFDTECCGLHGPAVLIQWAKDDGPIELWEVWRNPIKDTLNLIESFCDEGVVGFNLAFDWFHLCQIYTTFDLFPDREALPEDVIDDLANLLPVARFGPCLKPTHALDLMLHARKGPYQSTMDRKEIRIKKVPAALAEELAAELTKRIPLPDVYFERKENSHERWKVLDSVSPEFRDVCLKFAPSSALKALAKDALKVQEDSILHFTDIELHDIWMPKEAGYIPHSENWTEVIEKHIAHWAFNIRARQYASDDVDYTRRLYYFFNKPEYDDVDSVLACCVGAVRWHGYKIDVEALKKLKNESLAKQSLPFNYNAVAIVRKYLQEVMSPVEQKALSYRGTDSTRSVILEEISMWQVEKICESCQGLGMDADTGISCKTCQGSGTIKSGEQHPAAIRARQILDARRAKKEIELYDKLIQSGRFHASFKIIGARSGRMSGSDDLNPQGIRRAEYVRSCFPLADDGFVLCGGDFDSFEVAIADAVYKDPTLHEELLTGKKIHGIMGTFFFPPATYEDILKSKGAANVWEDKYTRSKNGFFALIYGGDENTLAVKVGIATDAAVDAYQSFIQRHQEIGKHRRTVFDMFCSMRQPKGLGTAVEWHEPKEYIKSMFGFSRYFTLENMICKALFDLANNPPKIWQNVKIKVIRRDRVQSASGAVRSAIFAAAFAVQAANMRAAANHEIQSTGAEVTKRLQKSLWDIQPAGINNWRILPMNIHDELLAPTHPDYVKDAVVIVHDFIEEYKKYIPLLAMKWKVGLSSWADK